jgi:hypothetical protein
MNVIISCRRSALRHVPSAFLFSLLFACARPPTERPAQVKSGIEPPPAEVSTIVVPVETKLDPIAREVNRRVEQTFSGSARERGIDVTWRVERGPVRLTAAGGNLHAAATIRYAMRACRGRFPCISCGFGEPMRVAEVRLHSDLRWDSQWRIRSNTRALPTHLATPCEVTWLGIDITRRFIEPVIDEQLRHVAAMIDRSVPTVTNMHEEASRAWTLLQSPLALGRGSSILFEPYEVQLSPIRGEGNGLQSSVALRARTRVVIGKPPVPDAIPLPPLRAGETPASGFRIPTDIRVPWNEATRIIAAELDGKTFDAGGKPVTISRIRIQPGQAGRVRIDAVIDYRAGFLRDYNGPITLQGTPQFDPVSSSIRFPDLDYTIESDRGGFLTRIAERTAHDRIRERLRGSIVIPVRSRLEALRIEISHALDRRLAPGVQLIGDATAIEPASVIALEEFLNLRIVVTGDARVDVHG